MRRRSGSSARAGRSPSASCAGLSGSTSSADSPSVSSSRAASVSAVITGAPVASASKTTAGIARDSRKPPSTIPACASASPRSSGAISLALGDAHRRLGERGSSQHDPRRRVGDLQRRERIRRRPRLAEDVLVGPEEDGCRLLGPELREVARLRVGAADDEVRQTEGAKVDDAQNVCRRRSSRKCRRTSTSSFSSDRTASNTSGRLLAGAGHAGRRSGPGSPRSRGRSRAVAVRAAAIPRRRR